MKAKYSITLIVLLLLNSCALKSLQPFYIKSAVSYQENFVGKWQDTDEGVWEVKALKDEFEKEKNPISKEDKQTFEQYKEGYFISYTKDDKNGTFLAMPFKVNNELFIDFVLFDYDTKSLNKLVKASIIETHTLAKVNFLKNGNVELKWFDEDKIKDLLDKNQLKIKHEELGLNETLLLTASSDELYAFLKKYTVSNTKDKWETDTEFILSKVDE